MHSLLGRRHGLRHASSVHDVAQMPNLTPFTRGSTAEEGRHEPQTFGARVPHDPYAAWLAQRDAEQERRQEAEVRWVVRPRTVATPAGGRGAIGPMGPRQRMARYGSPATLRLTRA
jgi:hypothetical protein